MKASGVMESDGEEAFSMIATATPCLMENGWMIRQWKQE